MIPRPLPAVPKPAAGTQMLSDTGLLRSGWGTCQDKKSEDNAVVALQKKGGGGSRNDSRRSYIINPKFNLTLLSG